MNLTKWLSTIAATLILGGLGAGLSFAGYQFFGDRQGTVNADPVALFNEQPLGGKDKAGAGKATDAERIVGTWIFTDGRGVGEGLPKEFMEVARMIFTKDGKMSMRALDSEKKGTFKVVEAGKLDISQLENKDAKAIYKFDGNDKLTLCFKEGDEKTRPTEFSSTKDNRQVLFCARAAGRGKASAMPAATGSAKPPARSASTISSRWASRSIIITTRTRSCPATRSMTRTAKRLC